MYDNNPNEITISHIVQTLIFLPCKTIKFYNSILNSFNLNYRSDCFHMITINHSIYVILHKSFFKSSNIAIH